MNDERMKQLNMLAKGMEPLIETINKVDKTKLTDQDKELLNILDEVMGAWGIHLVTSALMDILGVKE